MGLIYLLLIFALFVIFALLALAANIVRGIFGGWSNLFRKRGGDTGSRSGSGDTRYGREYTAYEKREKVFGPNEGEYVDFEEVKEEENSKKPF